MRGHTVKIDGIGAPKIHPFRCSSAGTDSLIDLTIEAYYDDNATDLKEKLDQPPLSKRA